MTHIKICTYHVWQAVGRILTSVQCQLLVCETESFRQSSVFPAQPHVITERLLTFDESYHLGVRWLHHVHSVNLVTEIYKYYSETECNSSLFNTKTVVFWSVTSCSLVEDLVRLIYGYDRALHVTSQKTITFAHQHRQQISSLFKQWYQCVKEMMWKRSWLSLRYHSGMCAEELQNTTNHHRNNRCPGGDSNRANPEHLLLLEPACSAAQSGTL
jgi:hypothetical protein